jgi:hypothetical protein
VKVLGRLLLVVALLFAQTGGVAHEIWHAASLAADGDGEAKTPKSNPLCDFHAALGSISAALSSAHHPLDASVQEYSCLVGAQARAPRFSFLAAQSRGPPALL